MPKIRRAVVFFFAMVLLQRSAEARRTPTALLPSPPAERFSSGARNLADTLFVGDPRLHSIVLTARTDTIEVFTVQNGERRLLSTSTQQVAQTPDGYLVVLESRSPRGQSLDSVWVARGTFATRRHVEVTPGGWRRVTFDDRHVRGSFKDSTGEHAIDVERGRAMVDNSVVSVLANALPLAPGYTVTIASYDIAGSDRTMTIRVLGAESFVQGARTVAVWKVTNDFTAPGQQWSVTRWVDQQLRRDLKWSLSFGGREMVGTAKED